MSIRLSVNGEPIVCSYQSFMHYLMLLIGAEQTVVDFLRYLQETPIEQLDHSVVRLGMFEGFARIVPRISEVYLKIEWSDASQDHAKFLAWLEEIFIPLLERLRGAIPKIAQLVDKCLLDKCGKTFEDLLQEIRQHRSDHATAATSA